MRNTMIAPVVVEDTPLLHSHHGIMKKEGFVATNRLPSPTTSSLPLPQSIAHRGYKAAFPENTLEAFAAALAVGSHALETDLHLTRDGTVVLSHDATLKRCFGRDDRIADLDYATEIAPLRTLRAPHCAMPTLRGLLEYLARTPAVNHSWLLLDIKRDDDAETLLLAVSAVLKSVPVSPGARPWGQRIVMGCWDAQYMRLCKKILPECGITYIGWSLAYATELLEYEGVSFNLLQQILVGPMGAKFLRKARALGRPVYVWTVNKEEWMEWTIRKGIDGVCTDDPKLFKEVCDRWKEGHDEDGEVLTPMTGEVKLVRRSWTRPTFKLYLMALILQIGTIFWTLGMRLKLGRESKRIRLQLAA